MLHRVLAATFKNMKETGHIAVCINIRVFQGVTDTCLRGQIDYVIEFFIAEQSEDPITVMEVKLDKTVTGIFCALNKFAFGNLAVINPGFGQSVPFELDLVIVID